MRPNSVDSVGIRLIWLRPCPIRCPGYLCAIMALYLFTAALIGMQLFGGGFEAMDPKPRSNFDTFYMSLLTVFQVLW